MHDSGLPMTPFIAAEEGASRSEARRSSRLLLVAIAALLFTALPLLMVQFFPTSDGPAHVATAMTLRLLADHSQGGIASYFAERPEFATNHAVALALAGLTRVVPPALAEKTLIGTYFLMFVFACAASIRLCAPRNAVLLLLYPPFIAGFLLQMGLYNYVFALVCFPLAMAWVERRAHSLRFADAASLGLLLVVCVFLHVIAGALLAAVLVTRALAAAAWGAAQDFDGERPHWRRALRRDLLPTLAASLPAVGLIVWLITQSADVQTAAGLGPQADGLGLAAIGQRAVASSVGMLASYSLVDLFLSAAVLLLMAVLLGIQLRRLRATGISLEDAWLLPIALLAAVFLLLPPLIEEFLHQRIALALALVVLFWLTLKRYDRRLLNRIAIAAILVNGLFTAWRIAWYGETNRLLQEYASVAPYLQANRTVFVASRPTAKGWKPCLRIDRQGVPCRIDTFRHFIGTVILDRHIVNLSNYQGLLDYFPVAYVPSAAGLAAELLTSTAGTSGTAIDAAAPARTVRESRAKGLVVDTVIVVRPPAMDGPSVWQGEGMPVGLIAALGCPYTPVYTSAPTGLVTLYRREACGTAGGPMEPDRGGDGNGSS